ncbi:MAG TPA: nuclear transport factor 2 family protein [Methanotrichaceae archaeon]|nr:nuclear transport factor 2 family protein [Methanotrichaceae archaeon]
MKDEIIDIVNRLFIYTDERDWEAVKDLFADEVLFDMTSMSGGEPATLRPQQIVDGWDSGLKKLKSIHHQAGNYVVDVREEDADLFGYGIAFHYLPNPTNRNSRIFVGSYDLHFIRAEESWKIDEFKFNLWGKSSGVIESFQGI